MKVLYDKIRFGSDEMKLLAKKLVKSAMKKGVDLSRLNKNQLADVVNTARTYSRNGTDISLAWDDYEKRLGESTSTVRKFSSLR